MKAIEQIELISNRIDLYLHIFDWAYIQRVNPQNI